MHFTVKAIVDSALHFIVASAKSKKLFPNLLTIFSSRVQYTSRLGRMAGSESLLGQIVYLLLNFGFLGADYLWEISLIAKCYMFVYQTSFLFGFTLKLIE